MTNTSALHRLTSLVVVFALLLGPIVPVGARAGLSSISLSESDASGLYCTRVELTRSSFLAKQVSEAQREGMTQSSRASLDQLGALVLDQGADWALVIVTGEQSAQQIGDFAFARARVENSTEYASGWWDKPRSGGFRHVRWVGVVPAFFDACKSHVCILRVNRPLEDALPPRGAVSPQGVE